MDFRLYMITFIRRHQYYKTGTLEAMSDEKLREIYESVLDWVSGE